MSKTLDKDVWLPHPPTDVWTTLTDPRALAEWLMPNNFEPTVGHVFRFHVDPMPGFSGINECKVLEVEPPRRLAYTWTVMPKAPDAAPPPPMTVEWTLAPDDEEAAPEGACQRERRGVHPGRDHEAGLRHLDRAGGLREVAAPSLSRSSKRCGTAAGS